MKKQNATDTNDLTEFLSGQEAAKFLRLKISTLYSLVEKRQIPFFRIGKRKLLFSKSDLINALTKHEVLLKNDKGGEK
jgi:excisionase family DNA binding protein